jgi:hypothetical protein
MRAIAHYERILPIETNFMAMIATTNTTAIASRMASPYLRAHCAAPKRGLFRLDIGCHPPVDFAMLTDHCVRAATTIWIPRAFLMSDHLAADDLSRVLCRIDVAQRRI